MEGMDVGSPTARRKKEMDVGSPTARRKKEVDVGSPTARKKKGMEMNCNHIIVVIVVASIIAAMSLAQDVAADEARPWDVNEDDVVDIADLMLVGSHFGDSPAVEGDVNEDGSVDILDLVLLSVHMGETYGPTVDVPMVPIEDEEEYELENGLYVWERVIENPEDGDDLIDACTFPGYRLDILLVSDHRPYGYAARSVQEEDARSFNTRAHQAGLKVYSLYTSKHYLQDMLAYNNRCENEKQKFKGCAMDWEGHEVEELDENANRIIKTYFGEEGNYAEEPIIPADIQYYLDAKAECGDLPLHVSIGHHWDNDIRWSRPGESPVSKPAYEHILDIVDSVDVQISYETASQIVSRSEEEIDYANALGKPVFLTIETKRVSGSNERLTFYNEGEVMMWNELENVNLGQDLSGFILHEYKEGYDGGLSGSGTWPSPGVWPLHRMEEMTSTEFMEQLDDRIADMNSGRFTRLTDTVVIEHFEALLTALLEGDLLSAAIKIQDLDNLGVRYKLVQIIDQSLIGVYGFMERVLPGEPDYKGWGAILVRPSRQMGSGYIIYQAPYVRSDEYTGDIALEAFLESPNARVAMFAGTHRYANRGGLPISDVTRSTHSLFHKLTSYLANEGNTNGAPFWFIQIHGSGDDDGRPTIVGSHDSDPPSPHPSLRDIDVSVDRAGHVSMGISGLDEGSTANDENGRPVNFNGDYGPPAITNTQRQLLEDLGLRQSFVRFEIEQSARNDYSGMVRPGYDGVLSLIRAITEILEDSNP